MDGEERQAAGMRASTPLRCQQCQAEMTWPVVCEQCHSLWPPGEQLDYFELLGLERRYEIDLERLRRNFLALNRRVHPDYFGTEADEVRNAAMRIAAQINSAYETLRQPAQRAEYILHLAGGPSSAQDKSVPAELLGVVMSLRDEIDEARAAGDEATLERLRGQVGQRLQAVQAAIRELATQLAEAPNDLDRAELRKQLNAQQYWAGLQRQLQ